MNNNGTNGDKGVLEANAIGKWLAIMRKATYWAYKCEEGAIMVA